MGSDFESLIHQIFVPELLNDPPGTLNVIVIEGNVGVVHVYPEADTLC